MSTGGATDTAAANDAALAKMNEDRKARQEERRRKKAADAKSAKQLQEVKKSLEDTAQTQAGTLAMLNADGQQIAGMSETQKETQQRAKKSKKDVRDLTSILPALSEVHLVGDSASVHRVVKSDSHSPQPTAASGTSDLDAAIASTADAAETLKALAFQTKATIEVQSKQLDDLTKVVDQTNTTITQADQKVPGAKKEDDPHLTFKRKSLTPRFDQQTSARKQDQDPSTLDDKIGEAAKLAAQLQDLAITTDKLVGDQHEKLEPIEKNVEETHNAESKTEQNLEIIKKKHKKKLCCSMM